MSPSAAIEDLILELLRLEQTTTLGISWDKGRELTNHENSNRLIGQYLPQESNLCGEEGLNSGSRKHLDAQVSLMVFSKLSG